MSFLFIVKQGSMEAEVPGFRAVDQAGGIIRAHLEQNSHLKFAQRFFTQISADVIIGVATYQDMNSNTGTFGYYLVQLGRWLCFIIRRKAKVIFITEFVQFVDVVNDYENCRSIDLVRFRPAVEFRREFGHHGVDLSWFNDGDFM